MKPTFLAVALFLREDEEAYAYFTGHAGDLDATTGTDLIVGIPDQSGGDSIHPFKELFDERGRRRYSGLRRGDLPCLWVEDQTGAHFILRIGRLRRDQIKDLLRDLTDAAAEATSLQAMEQAVRDKQRERGSQMSTTPALDWKNPMSVVNAAIAAVPQVKWALGVAGVMAALALGAQFFSSPGDAAVGFAIMIPMMVLLVLFAALTSLGGSLKTPALILTYFVMALFIFCSGMTASCIFLKKPMPFPELLAQFRPPPPAPVDPKPPADQGLSFGVAVTGKDGRAVPAARVRVTGAGVDEAKLANEGGLASFSLPRTPSGRIVIAATAPNGRSGKLEIDAPAAGSTVPVTVAAPPRPVRLGGVWEVVVVGDINNNRIRRGTFEFRPQRDGSLVVTANFRADGADVKLRGEASLTGPRLDLSFKAVEGTGPAWSGKGVFTLSGNQLSGQLTGRSGDDIPATLRRLK